MMLNGRRDNVRFSGRTAVRLQAKDGEIVAFRRAAREDHLTARGVDNRCYLLSGLLHSGAGTASVFVSAAAGVAEAGFQMAQENFADARVEGRCGGAIEIHRSITSLHAGFECYYRSSVVMA
jgi:hypothetical protein